MFVVVFVVAALCLAPARAQSSPAPCAAGSAGASAGACAACTGGATYSLGGSACAPCVPGATLASASAGCAALPSTPGPAGAALVFSGAQAEGFGGLQATLPSGLAFVADHMSVAAGALNFTVGSALTTAPLPQLPTAGASRSLAAWVKCAPPATGGGRALLDLSDGVAGSNAEHFQLRGLAAVTNSAPGLSGIVMNGGSVTFSWNAYNVTTFAGNTTVSSIDAVDPRAATFRTPSGVTADAAGNVFVAERTANKVRVIWANGTVETFAGCANTTACAAGVNDAVGTSASFSGLYGVTIDPTGTWLAIGDSANHRVRRIDLATRQVTTIAGNGSSAAPVVAGGWADGIGTNAMLNGPTTPNFAPNGIIYIVCTAGSNLRRIDPATGAVTTVAGSTLNVTNAFLDGVGILARFNAPRSSGIDPTGQFVYVADYGNNRVRKVSTATGLVTTLIGNSNTLTAAAPGIDGVGTAASIYWPYGIAVDGAGNLYVIENGARKIRRVSPAGATITIAGGAKSGASGWVDAVGTNAQFNAPLGVWATPAGVIYVADASSNVIRRLTLPSVQPLAIVIAAPVCDGIFWHHIAATFDGATAVAYVDGDIYSSTPAVVNTANGAVSSLGIGGAVVGANEGFAGAMHDVRVYASVLSPEDVLALSQPPLPAFANSVLNPPAATWGVYEYRYACAAGFSGAPLTLTKSVADNSWGRVGGPLACSPCTGGATYSFGGQACAPCAPGATLASASAGCAALPSTPGPAGAALVFSGAQAEGFGGLQATLPSGLAFVADHMSVAAGALNFSLGSSLATAPLPQLPTAGAPRAVAAWVKCSPPTTAEGRTLIDFGDGTQSSATEHLTLLGKGEGTTPAITLQPYTSTPFAGGIGGFADGLGTAARFSTPSGIAHDGYGNLYVADRNSIVRMVTPNGYTTTIAGITAGLPAGSTPGAVNAVGTSASFGTGGPQGVAVDPTGTYLAVADWVRQHHPGPHPPNAPYPNHNLRPTAPNRDPYLRREMRGFARLTSRPIPSPRYPLPRTRRPSISRSRSASTRLATCILVSMGPTGSAGSRRARSSSRASSRATGAPGSPMAPWVSTASISRAASTSATASSTSATAATTACAASRSPRAL